jgi:hypothetical protein
MNIRIYIFLLSFFAVSTPGFCQLANAEYYLTVNGNLYLPFKNPQKGIYPILGYDKGTDAKVLIGGWGAGIAACQPIKRKLNLKGEVNLSKHTYWDEPVTFSNESGSALGPFVAGSSDYAIGITATAQYFFTNKLAIGTGVGSQLLLVSLSRLPKIYDSEKLIAVNRYYKPIMPTWPVELSYKLQKKLFNVRYEHGLVNRLKGDLKRVKNDRYGLLSFEVGFKIK